MDIDLIETFIDIMETRSFNRTAERLQVTQSTVSHRVRSLEAALGKSLLVRGRGGAAPTQAGVRFHEHALLLRRQWREAVRQTRAAEAADRTMRVGLQYDVAEALAGPMFQRLRALFPQTSLAVEVDYSTQMISDMLAGELDVAVLFTPRYFPDLEIEHVEALPYLMVRAAGQATQTEAEALAVTRYCTPNISPALRTVHDLRHPEYAGARVSCGQSRSIVDVIRVTGGASYVSAPIARMLAATGELAIVAEQEPIMQPVYLAVAVRDRHRPSHAKCMGALREFLRGGGGAPEQT